MFRPFFFPLVILPLLAETNHTRYVPPGATLITAMEWKQVLDSPYRDLFRREIPAASASLLGGINFIEGIDRVIHAASPGSNLVVLQGRFELQTLRAMAIEDGGMVRDYKNAEMLLSGSEDPGTEMAIVSDRIVLLGDRTSLMAAIDRGLKPGPQAFAIAGHLWIFQKQPSPEVEQMQFSLGLVNGVRVHALIRTRTPEQASAIASSARTQNLRASAQDREVIAGADLSGDAFARRAGQWRTGFEQLTAAPDAPEGSAPAPEGPMKVRIYGLEGGTREITLPPSR